MANSDLLSLETEDLFIQVQYKLRYKLKNNGSFLLGTDVLRKNTRYDLFKIVTSNIENKFLSLLKTDFSLFNEKLVLFELIKLSTEDFLTVCYGSHSTLTKKVFSRSLYVQFLLTNSTILLKLLFGIGTIVISLLAGTIFGFILGRKF